MSGAPYLSLVIPAYNEAQRLEACVRALCGHLASANVSHEVVLVVERSTDGTLELARQLTAGQAAFRVIGNETQLGKGHAVRCGMLAARGEITFFMDADLSTPLAEITTFLAYFDTHPSVDVLIGNRAHAESVIVKSQSFVRRTMGQMFNVIPSARFTFPASFRRSSPSKVCISSTFSKTAVARCSASCGFQPQLARVASGTRLRGGGFG